MEENEEVEIPNEPVAEPFPETKEATSIAINDENEKPKLDVPVDISQNPVLTDNKLEKLAEELKNTTPNLVEPETKEAEKISLKIDDVSPEVDNLTSQTKDTLTIDFSDKDKVVRGDGVETEVVAPKDIETLEKIAEVNNAKRKAEEEDEDDKLNIGGDASLDLDIVSL